MVKKNILPYMINELRKQNNWTLEELGLKLNKSKSGISRWIKGDRSPMIEDLEKLADIFDVDVMTLLYGEVRTKKVAVSETMASVVKNLKQMNSVQLQKTLHFTNDILLENNSVVEKIRTFPVKVIEALAAGRGYSYGDNEIKTLYTDRDDLKYYDIASLVSGDSMEPKYYNGDVVLMISQPAKDDGYIYAIDYNNKSYLKKVYFEKHQWRLVSLNEKYADIIIPLNQEDVYLNLVGRVVDSFTPVIA